MQVRTRERREWSALVECARAALDRAWSRSIHHNWLVDVDDLLREDSPLWYRYGVMATALRNKRELPDIYSCEQRDVRTVAKCLNRYERALRSLNIIESRRAGDPHTWRIAA